MAQTMEASATAWWDARFHAFGERIPFKSIFFPLLLQTCDAHESQQQQQHALSQDELAAIVKHCVAENAWMHGFVTQRDFVFFVARFGPIELSISKVVSCFCVNNELVPWFHGLLSRADADRVLAATPAPPRSPTSTTSAAPLSRDGTFLIRFSESHPTKFTLSYVKIHASGPFKGKRELKNCLIENLGRAGYALSDSKTRAYASILSFVQRSAARLKHGAPSEVAAHCNAELAQIRALQDQQSNAYTAFSAETFDLSPSSSPSAVPEDASSGAGKSGRSLLFAQSPPMTPLASGRVNAPSARDCCADSYSGFTLDALTPPLALTTKAVAPGAASSPSFASAVSASLLSRSPMANDSDDVYGDARHFFDDSTAGAAATENNQQSHNAAAHQHQLAPGTDYGCFQSSVVSSPVLTGVSAPRLRQPLSPVASRPPLANVSHLLSPSRQQHLAQRAAATASRLRASAAPQPEPEDAYGTFESFASTFASDSNALAQRNRLALSFAKASSSASTASTTSLASSSGMDDAYGSFASLAVAMPSAARATVSPVAGASVASASTSTRAPSDSNSNDDYGSFAALVDDMGSVDLGPPPPPQGSQFAGATAATDPLAPSAHSTPARPMRGGSTSSSMALPPVDSDVYGSFASLASPPSMPIAPSAPSRSAGEATYGHFQAVSDSRFFPLEAKTKESAVLAQAASDSGDRAPVHAHTAACSALEELNAGMACYQEKRLDAALERFIHAQEVAKATDDKVVEARALGNLGTVYLDMQNAAQAVVCYQRCLDITRSIKDTKRERTILNNLVLALMASEAFDRALECCQVQLEMTTNEINRRKIFSRMSLLREKAARANRERVAAARAREL